MADNSTQSEVGNSEPRFSLQRRFELDEARQKEPQPTVDSATPSTAPPKPLSERTMADTKNELDTRRQSENRSPDVNDGDSPEEDGAGSPDSPDSSKENDDTSSKKERELDGNLEEDPSLENISQKADFLEDTNEEPDNLSYFDLLLALCAKIALSFIGMPHISFRRIKIELSLVKKHRPGIYFLLKTLFYIALLLVFLFLALLLVFFLMLLDYIGLI